MIKLTDTQRILLAAACQRTDGSVLPLHPSIKPGGGAAKAVAALLRHKLVEERESTDVTTIRRTDGDLCFGVFINDAGLAAIGVTSSYISRVVRLAFLAPAVTEAILAGRQRAGVTVASLTADRAIAADWQTQVASLLPARVG